MAKRARLALPPGQARPRLAEGQDARPPGVRDLPATRRARGGAQASFGSLVLGVRRRRAATLGRQLRHGLQRTRDHRELLAQLQPLERETSPFPVEPKMPKVRKGDVVWVEPRARLRGRVRRMDARRPPARARPSRACATTSAARGAPRAAGRDESARAALSGCRTSTSRSGRSEGDHEGRPDRLLPRRRAGARAAPARPAVHDAALSRRLARQGVLPEGRAEGHAGVDPDAAACRSRPASGRAKRDGSRRRSSTTNSRCCGW